MSARCASRDRSRSGGFSNDGWRAAATPHDAGGGASQVAACSRRGQGTPAEGVRVNPRTLGPTGYVVSELGLGAWGLGGDMWRGVDDDAARDALREAVARGITFFDT